MLPGTSVDDSQRWGIEPLRIALLSCRCCLSILVIHSDRTVVHMHILVTVLCVHTQIDTFISLLSLSSFCNRNRLFRPAFLFSSLQKGISS